MTKTLLIILGIIFLFGCTNGNFEKTHSIQQGQKQDTIPIYWEPIQYDTLVRSVHDSISFPGDDTLDYLPIDRDVTLHISFSGKMEEYMKYGKMIVRPYDSSVFVQRINNTSFKIKVNKPINDCRIGIVYDFTFNKPYYFSYIFDGKTECIKPNNIVQGYLRWFMTKPGDPEDC